MECGDFLFLLQSVPAPQNHCHLNFGLITQRRMLLTWYRYIEWLIHPSELNSLGEREYFSAGWSWFLRIMAILIFLGLGISSEIFVLRKIEQYRKAWDKYSIWILLISVSSIAVIGDVVRKYFPINLILLLGLINIAAMEIKIYCHNKRELY